MVRQRRQLEQVAGDGWNRWLTESQVRRERERERERERDDGCAMWRLRVLGLIRQSMMEFA